MTENEVIQRLKNRLKTEEQRYGKEFVKEYFDDIDFAISALEEIQQYRKIGSVGEIKQAIGVLSLSENDIIKTFHELNEYHKIGTVEECQEAVEKQEPKKPEVSDSDFDYYKCPVCGAYIWATDCVKDHNYCLNCGQVIDWEESEEE